MEEINEEKIIQLVLEEGSVCVLTNKGRVFIQTSDSDRGGNLDWREVELPDFKNE
jgi:hypothetical protein